MIQNYVLSGDIILRKEWFGCLVCNIKNGHFNQYNDDAFSILKEIKNPLTIIELKNILKENNFKISKKNLTRFLQEMYLDGVVLKSDKTQGALIFFENEKNLRKDCLASPSSVTIYITNLCTKACKHCVNNSSPLINQRDEYSIEEWFKILQKLRDFGVCSLVFTGGEPLLKDNIFEILKKADEMKFSISLLTDFDDLNENHIVKLKNLLYLSYIQVSLDGASEENHDFIRGKGSFVKAIQRMRLLQKHDIPYTISTTVNNRNISEIDCIVDISREYGAKYLYFNPLAPYGRAKERLIDWILSDRQLYWLGKKYLQLIADGMVNPGNPFWEENIEKINDDQFHPFKGALTAVSLGVYNFSIGSKGECYLDSKMKAENLLCLGNALDDDIKKMWHHPKLDFLRSHYSPSFFAFIDQSLIQEE
ncbi:MAG: radical SAM protein [Candidatus Pacebacteria bacterium]|nr:radical SAM protein [Candidatus Paceibacterota bacterium]MDD5752474.1 radical SAM protein [Candidatus Paceibacterota bacterium]